MTQEQKTKSIIVMPSNKQTITNGEIVRGLRFRTQRIAYVEASMLAFLRGYAFKMQTTNSRTDLNFNLANALQDY